MSPADGAPHGSLRLRPLRPDDEPAFVAGHAEMAAEGFVFGLSYEPGEPWAGYLARLDALRRGTHVPDGLVESTFLVAVVDGVIVGRSSIRHRLNEFLLREGGHIGYGVLPAHRRRGHATEILAQSLVIARSYGVDRALVTCDVDNVGSARVIERCGGVLESIEHATRDGVAKKRYWIA